MIFIGKNPLNNLAGALVLTGLAAYLLFKTGVIKKAAKGALYLGAGVAGFGLAYGLVTGGIQDYVKSMYQPATKSVETSAKQEITYKPTLDTVVEGADSYYNQ